MKRSLGALAAFLVLPFSPLQAQQRMDSIDRLVSARMVAYARVQNGFFPEALTALTSALKDAENRYGTTHPSIVPILLDIASLRRHRGEFREAEAALQWGLALREKALGPNDPLTAEALEHLAALYDDWGRWKDAEFFGQKALHLLEQRADTPRVALVQALGRLGSIGSGSHQDAEALAFLKRAQEILDKAKEGTPLLRMEILTLRSQADLALKKGPEAKACLEKALATAKETFPADSVEVGDSLLRLADLQRSLGQKEKARTLDDAALNIYKRYVGVDFSFVTLPFIMRLATAYQNTGDDKSALDLLEKALGASKSSYGPKHPRTAIALMGLARSETRLQQGPKAKTHAQEALAILKPLFPEDHPLVQEALELAGK